MQKNKTENKEPDAEIYKQLVEMDTKLGTTNTEQLWKCLVITTRLDIIKICLEVITRKIDKRL